MAYKYVAYTSERKVIEGTINVEDANIAERALEQAGYQVVSLKPVTPGLSIKQLMPTLSGAKVKPQDVIAFSRQLARLISSGAGLMPALGLLRGEVSSKAFREIISEIIEDLKKGKPFSEAISRHPQAFPKLYSRLIEVGEQTGELEVALGEVASHMEKQRAITKKVSRAMLYPTMVLLLAGGVIILLVTVALPALTGLFAGLDVELPLPTKILLGISDFVNAHKLQLLPIGALVPMLAIWYVRRPAGRRKFDELLLRVPLIGPINHKSEISRICRTMSMLLRAGLPLSEIMGIVHHTTQNTALRHALRQVHKELLQGGGLSGPMSQNKLFPQLVTQMVMVGEETGTLESNLATVADSYEADAEERSAAFTSMIEPVMTIFIALVVGFIALSVIMPMYSVLGAVK